MRWPATAGTTAASWPCPPPSSGDLRKSRDALEQITGEAVVGYRAPTFSVVRRTAWALDVLAEEGFLYDSSIYPVRHDRYGVPEAPRGPFLARGHARTILEFPPATLKVGRMTPAPAGAGTSGCSRWRCCEGACGRRRGPDGRRGDAVLPPLGVRPGPAAIAAAAAEPVADLRRDRPRPSPPGDAARRPPGRPGRRCGEVPARAPRGPHDIHARPVTRVDRRGPPVTNPRDDR